MLSFDITDRSIRIIRGNESGGKISIRSATTLDLEEEVIVNGHVQDVPRLATLINQVLKTNKMPDKEAIISISSNLTIFKELHVPYAKEPEFSKMVRAEMQSAMGIDENYSTSYIIVGAVEEDEKEKEKSPANEVKEDKKSDAKAKKGKNQDGQTGTVQKVLATACPYEVVDNYKRVFSMLGISLKSVMIGCNCITKVILADTKIKAKMPLLAVQIDNTFISLNIYENGQLTFSRFASIDIEDYGGSEDYVYKAVYENIFRMLQFQKNRNINAQIRNVVFYGDTHEYTRLNEAMSQLDISSDIIKVPAQIHGYQNIEFSLYANAVGAMFKRNKDIEKVNLLETDTVNNNKIKSDDSYKIILIGSIVASLAVIGIVVGAMGIYNGGIKSDIKDAVTYINSTEATDGLKKYDARVAALGNVKKYALMIQNAGDAYSTKPMLAKSVIEEFDKILDDTAKEAGVKASYPEYTYSDGAITVNIEATAGKDDSESFPALFIQNLAESGKYNDDIVYTGYSIETQEVQDGDKTKTEKKITFPVTVSLKGNALEVDKTLVQQTEGEETTADSTTDSTAEEVAQ